MILDNIRGGDSEHAIPEGFRVPNLASLNRYLGALESRCRGQRPRGARCANWVGVVDRDSS